MTDGGSSFYEADHEAGLLRKSGTSIVVIGVGSEINQKLLSAIADNSESLFLADDFNKLIADTSLILGKSCSAVESTNDFHTFTGERNFVTYTNIFRSIYSINI